MAAPLLSELNTFQGRKFNQNNWDFNCQKIIDFLTGSYDVTFGIMRATTLFGDVSNCTGFPGTDLIKQTGEAITQGDAVQINTSTGLAYKATSANAEGISNFVGIATATTASGSNVTIRRFYYSAYTSLTAGSTYYIGSAGAITTSKPATFAKPIGFALSATELVMYPETESNATFYKFNATNNATIGGTLGVSGLTTITVTGSDPSLNEQLRLMGSAYTNSFAEYFKGADVRSGLTILSTGSVNFVMDSGSSGSLFRFRWYEDVNTQGGIQAATPIMELQTGGVLSVIGGFSATTGTFSGAVSGTTGTFSGAISGTTGTFSGGIDAGGNGTALKFKVIQIGDWNMDSTNFVNVVHGLTLSKIRNVQAFIRDDAATGLYPIFITSTSAGTGTIDGGMSIDATIVQLTRLVGGTFDSASFDSTSYNRGWVTIWYEP